MTGEEFGAALRELGLPQRQFAMRAGVSAEAVNRWVRGHNPTPPWIDLVVELLRKEPKPRRKRGEAVER